jgi:1-acyl-sn-glycerol-3-phosphate acyltransferase
VAKRKGERYRLIWKQRMGFARLAIEAGCPVVPFGAVGGEETYEIIADADSPAMAPVRATFERLGGRSELLFPLAGGFAGTPLPRPQRFYFAFGRAIDTRRFRGNDEDERAIRRLRDTVRLAVEDRIQFLRNQRENDPERDVLPRLRRKVLAPPRG